VTETPAAFLIPGIVNLRDAGGQASVDGRRVRTGVLFRSGQLGRTEGDGVAHLGLSVVFDLRGVDELAAAPDLVPDDVELVHLDVLADSEERIATHLADLISRPDLLTEAVDSGAIDDHYRATYRNLVLLDSARASYATLFTRLAELDRPALFHCTAGKDRTGWAAAALLSLLGVEDRVVTEDYLRSSAPVIESFAAVFDGFAAAGGDRAALVPLFAVTEGYLQESHDTVREHFGSLDGWFRDGLGLGDDVADRLRARLLV